MTRCLLSAKSKARGSADFRAMVGLKIVMPRAPGQACVIGNTLRRRV